VKKPGKLEPFDEWMLSKLNSLVKTATDMFYDYRTGEAKRDVEHFFWNTFCDNYLEIIKDRIYNAETRGKEARLSAQHTLYNSILSILKMMAPVMPHITESIYHLYFAEKEKKKSIHISDWPAADEKMISKEAEKPGELAIDIISAVRRFKAEQKVSIAKECKLTVDCKPEEKTEIEKVIDDLKSTIKASELGFGTATKVATDKFNMKLDVELS
jgi:valyl-tRNA synthetase